MTPSERKSEEPAPLVSGPSIPMTGRKTSATIVVAMALPVVAVIVGLAWWFATHR